MSERPLGFETQALHAGQEVDPDHEIAVPSRFT